MVSAMLGFLTLEAVVIYNAMTVLMNKPKVEIGKGLERMLSEVSLHKYIV